MAHEESAEVIVAILMKDCEGPNHKTKESVPVFSRKGLGDQTNTRLGGHRGNGGAQLHKFSETLRNEFSKWSGPYSIGMVISKRTIGDKQTSERRYYVSSLPCDVESFAQAV